MGLLAELTYSREELLLQCHESWLEGIRLGISITIVAICLCVVVYQIMAKP